MNFGFFRVAAAVPDKVDIAYSAGNAARIIEIVRRAAAEGVRVVVFPELSVTGYTCGDLLRMPKLADDAERALSEIADATAALPVAAIVGMPVRVVDRLYNKSEAKRS